MRRLQQWFTDDGLVREPTDDELRRLFETVDFDEIEVDESGLPRLVKFVKQQLEEKNRTIEVGETSVPLDFFLRLFMSPEYVPTAGSERPDRESAKQRFLRVRVALSRAISERLDDEERIALETWLIRMRSGDVDDDLMLAAERTIVKLKTAIGDECGPIEEIVRAVDSHLYE
jgi:hypothetical protein